MSLTQRARAGAMKIRGIRLTPQQQKYALIGGGVAAAAVAAAVLVPKVMGASVGSISLQAGTSGNHGIAPFTAYFHGEVLDVNSKPIPNFHLSLFVNGRSAAAATTDKSGQFVFQPVFTKGGTYDCYAATSAMSSVKSPAITVTVQAPSGGSGLASITISASATQADVGQKITVSGKFLDQNGNGVVGKTAYLFDGNSSQLSQTTTGSDGGYSFDATFSQAGQYSLDVSDLPTNS